MMRTKVTLVSVIMPCFNAGNYITEALLSVLKQTHREIEIIVVNDGSNDSTEANIAALDDSRIRYFKIDNSGQSAAANVGLSKAKGDFIKFFDADDVMNATHVESQLAALKGDITSLALCDWSRFYNDDITTACFNPKADWERMEPLQWVKQNLHGLYDMMPGWGWLIPRQILEQTGGWNSSLSLNNDFEFSMRLAMHASSICFAAEARMYYRSGVAGSLSNVMSEASYRSAILSAQLGFAHFLQKENSAHTRLLFANKLSYWLYQLYPYYPSLVRELEKDIAQLGGTNRKIDESPLMHFLQKLIGWKMAKRFKLMAYRLGYRGILLDVKKKLFPPTISHR